MKYLLNGSTDPWYNMSFDEYCLVQPPSDDVFFYLWRNRPSVIIGENQNARAEVNLKYLEEKGITLARRSTGGGAVYHDLGNLNYSIVGKHPTPEVIAEALRGMGVDARLSGRNDIFVGQHKVSGYARRLYKDRELIHGTLMYDVDISVLTQALDVPGSKLNLKGVASVPSRVRNLRDLLPYASVEEFRDRLQSVLADGDPGIQLPSGAGAEIERICREKYSTPEWIYGRV